MNVSRKGCECLLTAITMTIIPILTQSLCQVVLVCISRSCCRERRLLFKFTAHGVRHACAYVAWYPSPAVTSLTRTSSYHVTTYCLPICSAVVLSVAQSPPQPSVNRELALKGELLGRRSEPNGWLETTCCSPTPFWNSGSGRKVACS